MRLITVVMNVETTQNRNKDTIAMMDYGFNMYSLEKIVKANNKLGDVKVNLGVDKNVSYGILSDVTVLNNSQNDKRNVTYDINVNEVTAPVKMGDEIGKLNVYENGDFKYSVPLTVMNDVKKANIFIVFFRNLKDIFSVNI